jgi:hypothetical protein
LVFKEAVMRGNRIFVALAVASVVLSGCYVVPVQTVDGIVLYEHYPLPPPGTLLPPSGAGVSAAAAGPTPATLSVRLYPANEVATQTGIVSGSVTNMMTGKGRFLVNYRGEVLTGEATRVSTEEKRGVASAFSPNGMFLSCEYQLNTPYQGTGTCTFSNGAKYQMHIGGS